VDVLMPQLSDSMEEGTVLSWLKANGDKVEIGDELVEIETDKAAMTYEAEAAGFLEIVAAAGESVAVGALIARLAEQPAESAPTPVTSSDEAAIETNGDQAVVEIPEPAVKVGAPSGGGDDVVRASPLARRLAADWGITLSELQGRGPGGRVVIADVEAAAGRTAPSTARPRVEPAAPADETNLLLSRQVSPPAGSDDKPDSAIASVKGEPQRVEPNRVQAVIARRMAEAKATIPEFSIRVDVSVDDLIGLRAEMRAMDGERRVPSLNDFVVKATALALKAHPKVNGSYQTGVFELYPRINIGVAVAADEGLFVPTIFDADEKSVGQIAEETSRLAQRARTGELTPPELAGGTFTISNLGMYGVADFVPIINPPQAGILAVGAASGVLARNGEGALVERQVMPVTLVGDHRILNGSEGAEFLGTVREALEKPLLTAVA
jgi:pyruvate dehydrogenase E2 component (dihydrolipoamide acetyltransferase)